MAQVHFDPGIYTNVFPAELPADPVTVMSTERGKFPDLRPLREKIQTCGWNARVYAAGSTVYAYGADMRQLAKDGFTEQQILLAKHPRLASCLIVEGLVDAVGTEQYWSKFGKGRQAIYRPNPVGKAANGKVQVYLGYDLRAIYWGTESDRRFGLVVDIAWAFRDEQGQPLDMHQVAQRNATIQVAQIQGEYLPGKRLINTMVAQQRLQEQILPFVHEHAEFTVPCGGTVRLGSGPVRVILGGYER